jgi:small subunit ribosomal protein S21
MPIEKALRKFKSICKKEGIIDEVKKRRAYEKPSSKKRKTDRKNNKPKRPVTRKGRA